MAAAIAAKAGAAAAAPLSESAWVVVAEALEVLEAVADPVLAGAVAVPVAVVVLAGAEEAKTWARTKAAMMASFICVFVFGSL